MQNKELPKHFSPRRQMQALARPGEHQPEKANALLAFTAAVLLLLLAIVAIDQHSAALEAIGLLGHTATIDPIFMSP
ncbi:MULTISPECIES: hypothetical protein [unclassified Bradyrhizobium]|uniref:hypothetical protein n=1 Tax=unclassified Bradyrhizobium TaxID=2631580 RepID=UPI002478F03C|nr:MULTISPECIES: hypothetical protein [unclassified Bradyrhizobium]WGR74520.1 hypothetical protein MTX24_17535 [Bradyrhizobium sp. ISRA426]WGR79355.1 hypothetical protein MTX21_02650 [Bradyrhizobium sp. ISRA430]WGR89692.1 hypothetical protein MTX25_17215 [Bradyrhizobium sp. ISRA432]